MTDLGVRRSTARTASTESALQSVTTAFGWVTSAKRTHSPELLARAEKALQAAIDDARDSGVPWGLIGSTLGIARGNAYQRYRKRLTHNTFEGNPARIA